MTTESGGNSGIVVVTAATSTLPVVSLECSATQTEAPRTFVAHSEALPPPAAATTAVQQQQPRIVAPVKSLRDATKYHHAETSGNFFPSVASQPSVLMKDMEQLSLTGGGGGGHGHSHGYAREIGERSSFANVVVGGTSRRNSRPRDSPIHQARSNVIAENLQALVQTDSRGAPLQDHLSESHRGTIHTAINSPPTTDGRGAYGYYYASKEQAQAEQKKNTTLSTGSSDGNNDDTDMSSLMSKRQLSSTTDSTRVKPFLSTGKGGAGARRRSRPDASQQNAAAAGANDDNSSAADELKAEVDRERKQSELDAGVTLKSSTNTANTNSRANGGAVFLDASAAAATAGSSSTMAVTPNSTSSSVSSNALLQPTISVATNKEPKPTLSPATTTTTMTTEPQMVVDMLNSKMWKRLTEKSMLQKASSSDMLKCVGYFLHRRFHHLSHLFQPNEPVLWMRGVDRSLIAQGWQDMAFLSPANIVFVYMLMRTLDSQVAGSVRQLQAYVLTVLYIAYSYMGHEISYPVRLFLAADAEHKDRFWLRCIRIVDDVGESMLKINNDPLLFSSMFHELISHMRYVQQALPTPQAVPVSSSATATTPSSATTKPAIAPSLPPPVPPPTTSSAPTSQPQEVTNGPDKENTLLTVSSNKITTNTASCVVVTTTNANGVALPSEKLIVENAKM